MIKSYNRDAMRFFEFYFNPKNKKADTIFDSFCFVPETKFERNLGYLYLVGELKNVLPKTQEILTELAEIIKREYYKLSQREASESFKEGLVKANEFLASEIRKENTVWLGNLKFAAVSLAPNFLINFSKVGGLKILLLREGEVFDIGERVSLAASPVKPFPNVVEGNLTEKDKILVVTEDIFEVFDKEGIFQDLLEVKKPRQIKKIFKEKKKILKEILGVCLLIIPGKKGKAVKKIQTVNNWRSKISIPVSSLKFFQRIFPQSFILREKLKKALIALLILIILLLLGYLIFK